MATFHIHIRGQIQGVGFRPYVFRLAEQFGLKGWVNNASDGVHVEFNAGWEDAKKFYDTLIQSAPTLSKIISHEIKEVSPQSFHHFEILPSEDHLKADLLLTPDFALCEDCRQELKNAANRRFYYPFITCINCGPRFSIIKKLPYDRERTTMEGFEMCPACQTEYNDIKDRRYFSQTNSCATCGVQLQLLDKEGHILLNPLQNAIQLLKDGRIGAIKGIGGYLLLCDATNAETIQSLRERKCRPTKPLALLYPDLAVLGGDVNLHQLEKNLLQSPAAPIMLLHLKNQISSNIQLDLIAPGLRQIGAMLPYNPLFELIATEFRKPLVATSGNLSGAPIIYEDEKALHDLSDIADFVVINDRNIILPQDDSVIRLSTYFQQSIIIRRSRGLSPTILNKTITDFFAGSSKCILAMGADLKSTFTLLKLNNVYVSQHLGDLDDFESQQSYQYTLQHFMQLFDSQIEKIIIDQHPAYFSTQLGVQWAQQWGVPIIKVQHHQAHALAVLGENYLLDCKEPVLNIIWDGTGYGDDGQIWGGEFFYYHNYKFLRASYFDYFPCLLGDKMPKEPRISGLCLTNRIADRADITESKFTATEWNLYKKILEQPDLLQTSSVGRLFDGVASLLGLADKVSYEGEAAMQLESIAKAYFQRHGLHWEENYDTLYVQNGNVNTQLLVSDILSDLEKGKAKDFIAAKFHVILVMIIKEVAIQAGCTKLAFSGGVFQNELLIDLLIYHLQGAFELYFHQQLSPNDENISFGQLLNAELMDRLKTN